MVDVGETDDSSSTGDNEPPEPLVKWERICALAIGSICGGAGGYAVFEKSNQAGTAMLLILAAIFLLIGVQGTPLIRFGSNSGSVELERRRRKNVLQALEVAWEENNTQRIEGIVEGVKLVAPDLVPSKFETYGQYENGVAAALVKMGYDVVREAATGPIMADLKIVKKDRAIYAELKQYANMMQANVVQQAIGIATVLSAPLLIIGSTGLTISAQAILGHGNVDFVQWRSEADNPELRATVERLFAQAKHDDGGASGPNGSS